MFMHSYWRFKSLLVSLLLVISFPVQSLSPVFAFDYLEHLYITDVACTEAEKWLYQTADQNQQKLIPRLLALHLVCPQSWDKPYCIEGYKQARSLINIHSQVNDDYSMTLGDLASSPDHIAKLGQLKNLTRSRRNGIIELVLGWFVQSEGGISGAIEDVAEDACEVDGKADWKQLNLDFQSAIDAFKQTLKLTQPAMEDLKPLSRAPLLKGPSDPAGLYSFDNPHYLDLIFRNHHHFGARAYSSWLGYHSLAIQVAEKGCENVIDVSEDTFEEYTQLDQEDIEEEEGKQRMRALMCTALSKTVHHRLQEWFKRSPRQLQERLLKKLPQFNSLSPNDPLIKETSSAFLALLIEGVGLHFLQDMLASGHMRTIRTRGGLQEARYDHDSDNEDGVVAILQTHRNQYKWFAYGDTYLLGFGPDPKALPTEKEVARRVLGYQRGLLILTSLSSLIDWAHGGLLYEHEPNQNVDKRSRALIEETLPTRPTLVDGEEDLSHPPRWIGYGNLPVPPPPFSYEALSTRLGFDVGGEGHRLGLQMSLLDTLGWFAPWLTSYRFALNLDQGNEAWSRWGMEFGYGFHFRWAARFTVDLGLTAQMNWRSIVKKQNLFWQVGIIPFVGLSLLPEGWVKLPLEFSFSYQLPLTFYDGQIGFPGANLIDGHFLMFSLGLAFMH